MLVGRIYYVDRGDFEVKAIGIIHALVLVIIRNLHGFYKFGILTAIISAIFFEFNLKNNMKILLMLIQLFLNALSALFAPNLRFGHLKILIAYGNTGIHNQVMLIKLTLSSTELVIE